MNWLFVFIGGGLGASARYLIARLLPQQGAGFPTATFVANVLSCIILGYLLGYMLSKNLDTKWQLLFITGFCGGFSTFSTFSAESFKLLEAQAYSTLLIYILSSILVCLISIWIGIKISA
ncbi:MAG: fluoride efflux transporter CrcB [Saprospiraceae bacterium]|nr:fluoride efflux transporter CrcB [Saprospiraceae bacterium]